MKQAHKRTFGTSDRELAQVEVGLRNAVAVRRRAANKRINAQLRAIMNPRVHPSDQPIVVELAVMSALAKTYGTVLLTDEQYAPVLDHIAEWGAVSLVQRALWSCQADDFIRACLTQAHEAFNLLCDAWPEVFMTEACAALKPSKNLRTRN